MEHSPSAVDQESGVLLVDKPAAWTSHDVVKFIRRFGFKKVGHCGTLDPDATGVLVVVLGRCTKLTDRFSNQDKVYQGAMMLGTETFTQDAAGEVTATYDWSHVTEAQVRAEAATFLGEQTQIPPMVSAVKQDGEKLYKLARQGITVEREPRPVTIHEFTLDEIAIPRIKFTVKCSKGTYVRTLCHDLGKRLNCGAHLEVLRRLRSGRFSIEQAVTMDTLKTWDKVQVRAHLIPLQEVLAYV